PKHSQRLHVVACWIASTMGAISLTSAAADPLRERIVVEGNRRVDAETVRSYFHATSEGKFDEAARDAALKALIATNLFDQI
ncbi:hypothetical protein, partial [Acinetobacter baumannii]|uniref:hypothetical protein n=1 Tax=Acinetobacter baumannii TaxID=470 RepID=UPI001488CF60